MRCGIRHPASLAYWFGSYIGIGMVWGAIKWYFYCVKQRKRYEEAKADFLYHLISIKVPEAKDNKEKIMNWM